MTFSFNLPAPIFTFSDQHTQILFATLIFIICHGGIGFVLPHFILNHTDRQQIHIAIILYTMADLLALFISIIAGALLVGAIYAYSPLFLVITLMIQTAIAAALSGTSHESHDA